MRVCASTRFNRRRILISLIGSAPFAALSIGGASAWPKVAQSAAHYQPTPKEGKACAACYAFITPNQCNFLQGEISPSGWCRLWKAKPDRPEEATLLPMQEHTGGGRSGRLK
jgi:hypothetical protein